MNRTNELLEVWNAAVTDARFKLDARALESRPILGQDLNLEYHGGKAVGFIAISSPQKPYRPNDTTGHVRLIAVHPDAQHRGVGSGLLGWAEHELRSRGATKIAFGMEPHHFFPGVPVDWDGLVWLEKRDYALSMGVSNDLARDLSDLPALELPTNVRLSWLETERVLEFVQHEFPGRWPHDVRDTLERGAHQHLALEMDRQVLGFALIGLRSDPAILPSSLWSSEDCGLGPMGVSHELRGRGLGMVLLVAAMHALKTRGGTRMGIDWTGVQTFYEKAGFQIVRQYRHAFKTLE